IHVAVLAAWNPSVDLCCAGLQTPTNGPVEPQPRNWHSCRRESRFPSSKKSRDSTSRERRGESAPTRSGLVLRPADRNIAAGAYGRIAPGIRGWVATAWPDVCRTPADRPIPVRTAQGKAGESIPTGNTASPPGTQPERERSPADRRPVPSVLRAQESS